MFLHYVIIQSIHCVKSVQIRSFFWSVFSRIQPECGKIRTRKNSIFGHFSHSDSIAVNYLTSIFTFPTVDIYQEIGNNENFSKSKNLILSSKFIKFTFSKARFQDDLTRFRGTERQATYLRQTAHFFYFSLISIDVGKLHLADISQDQQMLS